MIQPLLEDPLSYFPSPPIIPICPPSVFPKIPLLFLIGEAKTRRISGLSKPIKFPIEYMCHVTKKVLHATGACLWIDCSVHVIVDQAAEKGHVEARKAQEDAEVVRFVKDIGG